MLKILYVGGIYATEYGLYLEAKNNPNLEVVLMSEGASILCDNIQIPSLENLLRVKQDFKPDLCLFRGWCPEVSKMSSEDILWSLEIMVTNDDGVRFKGSSSTYSSMYPSTYPDSNNLIAYDIKNLAKDMGQYWLPRCVTKHWSRVKCVKDIPFMVATNMPSVDFGGDLKRKSLDILVKPVVSWNKDLVHAFEACSGGLSSVEYMRDVIKPSFPYGVMHEWMSRAKIYASPTTIWNDPGCISQKTTHAMACNTLTITNRYEDIEDILGPDGENLIYSNSEEETLDKVKYYLSNDVEREAIASRGYKFIHNTYNWETHLSRLKSDILERSVK